MSTAFNVTVTTTAAPEQVWEVLTDWSRAPLWMHGVEKLIGPENPVAGSVLTVISAGKERQSTVLVADPGRELTLRSVQGGATADYRYVISAAGAGSQVSLIGDVRVKGLFMLVGAGIRFAVKGFDGDQLTQLKTVLDSLPKPQL